MIAIEKNVPVGDGRRIAKGKSKYPFPDMEVGDSFLVPYEGRETGAVSALMATNANRHLGAGKFRVSKQEDGVRVWRLA